jgi:hypothetical protein
MIEEGCKRMKRKRDDGDFPKINKRRTQTEEKKLRYENSRSLSKFADVPFHPPKSASVDDKQEMNNIKM